MAVWEPQRLKLRRLRIREQLAAGLDAPSEVPQRVAWGSADEALARADSLVGRLLEELNAVLLTGQGVLRRAPLGVSHGSYLWELWWEPRSGSGRRVLVTLLRDSRGTAYLRVQRRRLALSDALLEGRLRRALQAAFAQPARQQPEDEVLMRVLDSLLGLPPRRLPRPR